MNIRKGDIAIKYWRYHLCVFSRKCYETGIYSFLNNELPVIIIIITTGIEKVMVSLPCQPHKFYSAHVNVAFSV